MERIDYLSKIDLKDAKTGILIQAEFGVAEFIITANKNTLTGLDNAIFTRSAFPYASYSCHESRCCKTHAKCVVVSEVEKMLHHDKFIRF